MIIPQKMTARLADRTELNDRFVWYRFDLNYPAKMVNDAGQYVLIEVAPGTMRAYSMCDRPDVDSSFEIVLDQQPNGLGVNFLRELAFGDQVNILAPLGQLTIKPPAPEEIILLATGSGVSPFRAILTDQLQIRHTPTPITLIWSVNHETEFFWLEDFQDWQNHFPNFHFYPVASEPSSHWQLSRGFVTDVLANLTWAAGTTFYLCGSPLMLTAATQYLQDRQIPLTQIITEQFTSPQKTSN